MKAAPAAVKAAPVAAAAVKAAPVAAAAVASSAAAGASPSVRRSDDQAEAQSQCDEARSPS